MVGTLISSCDDSEMLKFDENYRKSKKYGTSLDIITFEQLMDASVCGRKFSFNDPATADGSKSGETIRSSGIIISCNYKLTVPVSYTNRHSDVNQLKYKYLPVASILY